MPSYASRMTSRLSCLLLPVLYGASAQAGVVDVALTMTANAAVGKVGIPLAYTLKATNQGSKVAHRLVLTDPLPSGVELVGKADECRFRTKTEERDLILTCKAKKLAPGMSVTWSIEIMPKVAGPLANTASVKFLKSRKKDPNPENNTATLSTKIQKAGNVPPVALDVSRDQDPSVPYAELQLLGSDADGDTLVYELLANRADPPKGYSSAYVNPKSGILNVTIVPDFTGSIVLPYRVVSDGTDLSLNANATINVRESTDTRRGLGGVDIDPAQYATFERSQFASILFGTGGTSNGTKSVDLSPDFPIPGNQGAQNSCVPWAVGYSLKTYQEGIEIGWSLNAVSHLFSPAYIYNQLNGGQDKGTLIHEALDFVINHGVATLDMMPYSDQDFLSQPNAEAIAQAGNYKALQRKIVSSIADIKGALVNRRPVVVGLKVYDSFFYLNGPDAVYNTQDIDTNEIHTNVIVGYNDAQFGTGAFKLINSWGTRWGDKGYYWLPYDFAAKVIGQAYVLEDGKNGGTAPDFADELPPPGTDLPDLQLQDWKLEGDSHIGGPGGKLSWGVVNAGTATAPKGISVSLMLSRDNVIDPGDPYLVYELIPYELGVGEAAVREDETASGGADGRIPFLIPPTLQAGDYYFALWVDDLNEVVESDETNNITFSATAATLTNYAVPNALPDLAIASWGLIAMDPSGRQASKLVYKIQNNGGTPAPAGWTVSLIASTTPPMDDGALDDGAPKIRLWSETYPYLMPVNSYTARDALGPALFNMRLEYLTLNPLLDGTYYLALRVDDAQQIAESNENNTSFLPDATGTGLGTFTIGQGGDSLVASPADSANQRLAGRNAVGQNVKMLKVRISETAKGERGLTVLEEVAPALPKPGVIPEGKAGSKTIKSANAAIFPVRTRKAMPLPQ